MHDEEKTLSDILEDLRPLYEYHCEDDEVYMQDLRRAWRDDPEWLEMLEKPARVEVEPGLQLTNYLGTVWVKENGGWRKLFNLFSCVVAEDAE